MSCARGSSAQCWEVNGMLKVEFHVENIDQRVSLACSASTLMKTVFTCAVYIARAILMPDNNSQYIILLVGENLMLRVCTFDVSLSMQPVNVTIEI